MSVVNVKVDPDVKKQAQKIAQELGLSLSSLINGYLHQLIKTKSVYFTSSEEPTNYMLDALRESQKNVKSGKVSRTFDNVDDAIAWLENPKARYKNGDRV